MAEALYRKYRPSKLSEVYGQEVVVKTLIKSFINDKFGHAYLFSGPRGTGKTSLAKIIARTINCEKYPVDEACGICKNCKQNVNGTSDIIEIDAASNNGVDEIRELRSNARFLPTSLKYKVYIIDEVHMLSTGAFNALLKTLEEPPKHVVFILATTEIHKIPETIISRCQCFNLNKIDDSSIIERISNIINEEKFKVEDGVVESIARLSNGGLRDAVNMLDQLSSFSDEIIKLDDVFLLNGIVDPEKVFNIIKAVFDGNLEDIHKFIFELKSSGKDMYRLTEDIIEGLKKLILDNSALESVSDDEFIFLIKILNENLFKIRDSFHSDLFLEIALLSAAIKYKKTDAIKHEVLEEAKVNSVKIKEVNPIDEKKGETPKRKKIVDFVCEIKDEFEFEEFKINRINNIFSGASKEILKKTNANLKKLEEFSMDKEFSSIINLIMDGNVRVASDWGIIFSFGYDSMVEKFNCSLLKIEDILKKIFNGKMNVIAISNKNWEKQKKQYIATKDKKENYFFVEEDFDLKELFLINNKKEDSLLVEEAFEKLDEDLIEID